MLRPTHTTLVTAVIMPVVSLLSLFVVVGAFRWPPVMAVAGVPKPAPVVAAAPASEPTATSTRAATPTTTRAPTTTRPPVSATARSSPPVTTAAPAPRQTSVAQPRGTVRLARGGTAKLIRTELEAGGVLPVPEDLGHATWWGAGLTARAGATVLAGHVNWRGRIGPFAELWQSRIGDRVSVLSAGGRRWTYRVSQVLTVPKEDLPDRAEELFGQQGAHRIVLVTCGGRWIGGSDGYEENRIVIAEEA